MKKLLFVLLALVALFASCSNSSEGSAGLGLLAMGGGSRGENTDADPVLVGASNLVYIGEGTETVNSTQYKVKKYADVLVDNPYFYTYYKLYYLNGKLRRVYQFDHGIGHEMDYKYTEFVEHYCNGGSGETIVFTYYENGKLESRTQYSYIDGVKVINNEKWYYANGNIKLVSSSMYISPNTGNFYYSYPSGCIEGLYFSGELYTFSDNIIKSINQLPTDIESVCSSKEDLTPEQARAKLEQLKNN